MQGNSSNATIDIYAYPKMSKGQICTEGRRSACHKKYAIDSLGCEDFGDARMLIGAIRNLACLQFNLPAGGNPSRYLVILNPFSGGGGVTSKTGAKYIYQTMLNPMLEEAGIEHDVLVTGRGGHARDRMSVRNSSEKQAAVETESEHLDSILSEMITDSETKDISEYNAIIAMGGDGILFEIMQGIRTRADEKEILEKVKFGIIGCGTSNGLAKSILHWSDVSYCPFLYSIQLPNLNQFEPQENYGPLESIFHICRGNTAPLDIASYQLANSSQSYTSFLTFTWGLIADCDLDSECLRWLGSLRQGIWAVYRGILFPKVYRARFSYLPPECAGREGNNFVTMPEFGKPLPSDWVTIEDDFKVFWVSNVSHPAYNMHLCPMSKMNDGLFHIVIVR
jgi:diacylglycerol kinase family enzyme